MRILMGVFGVLALTACAPAIPDSGAGVGARATATGDQPAATVLPEVAADAPKPDAPGIPSNPERPGRVDPSDLSERPDDSMSLVVDFALGTTNAKGQALYSRSKLFAKARFNRACAKYPSSDQAQAAFLKNGGPQSDPNRMDPDGDGFACYWDPEPFRQAAETGQPAPVVLSH